MHLPLPSSAGWILSMCLCGRKNYCIETISLLTICGSHKCVRPTKCHSWSASQDGLMRYFLLCSWCMNHKAWYLTKHIVLSFDCQEFFLCGMESLIVNPIMAVLLYWDYNMWAVVQELKSKVNLPKMKKKKMLKFVKLLIKKCLKI